MTRIKSLFDEFMEFHAKNPHVYKSLVFMARRYRRHHPGAKIGIATLYEALRWDYFMQTNRTDDFKLNNNHRSLYARLIMRAESDLSDIFETRVRKTP